MTDQTLREAVLRYAKEQYGTVPAYLWERTPDVAALRHANGKWYGLVMRISGEKLGLSQVEKDILNVKCNPLEIGSLQQKAGIFPAYHMNKAHWITVLLDGTVSQNEIFWLLDESYAQTMPKPRKRKGNT